MLKLKYHSSRLFNILTIVILSILCMLLGYLTKINFHRLELPKDKPEFSTTGIIATLYSPAGDLLYKVAAESGIEYPNSSKILLINLDMQAFAESSGGMLEKITSNDGWVDTAASTGFLGESVVLTVANLDPKQIIYVYTSQVNLEVKTKYIYSKEFVRATQGKSTLTGNGFNIDYEKKLLTIESNVKVIYEK